MLWEDLWENGVEDINKREFRDVSVLLNCRKAAQVVGSRSTALVLKSCYAPQLSMKQNMSGLNFILKVLCAL